MPKDRDLNPLISVIVPCRNERQHIDAFCDSALRQVLPEGWRMEDNPGRIVSTGLNACIARAQGAIIARLDVHSQFAPDYLAQCIQALERTGADNVGGPWVARGASPTGAAVAAAFQCRWVVGGARSRDVDFEGSVDTVYLGCWPRGVFERFGTFDESLVRNQDDEHNLRLRLGGARIWQSRLIRSTYQPRSSLRHLFSQQRQYGYWRPFVMRKHGQPGALRQLVPAIFVAAVCLCALLLPWTALPLVGLAAAYGSYLLAASAAAARTAGDWALLPRLPAAIAAFHVGYGLGSWRGLWDVAQSRKPSADFARITR